MTYAAVPYASGPYAGPIGAAPAVGTFPAVDVQIAFTSAPGASPAWASVFADVVAGSVNRGRQRELDRYQAGTLSVTLRNDQRQYDPDNTAGPWYGYIKPMRRIRVLATFGGATYAVFTGFIDRWSESYPGPHESTVEITATDAFKVLAAAALPTSAHAQELKVDAPSSWYRLDAASAATLFYDSGSTARHLTATGTTQGESLIARDDNASVVIPTIGAGAISPARTTPADVTRLTVDMMVQVETSGPGAGQTLAGEVNALTTMGWVVECDTGQIQVTLLPASGVPAAGVQITSGVTSISDGRPHHIVVRWDGGTVYLYLDGAVIASTALSGTLIPAGTDTYMVVGGATNGLFANTGALATIDELAVYYRDVGATRIAAHYETVNTPWNNDLPGARAGRVLDAIGWPADLRELDTGVSVLQPATLNMSALEHLQKVAESEFGALYTRADGTVRLEGRQGLVNQPTLGTFTDTYGSNDSIRALVPEYGDELIRNEAIVSRADGAAQVVRNTASVSEYLLHSYTLDGLIHKDDSLSRSMAELIVSEYATPVRRIGRLDLMPQYQPAVLFPQVLARELTDRVTVQYRPVATGADVVRSCVIEGISHEFGNKSWSTTWSLSPALSGAFWQLGVVGYSELGTTTGLFD